MYDKKILHDKIKSENNKNAYIYISKKIIKAMFK